MENNDNIYPLAIYEKEVSFSLSVILYLLIYMMVLTKLVNLMGRIIVAGEKGSHFAAMFDSELNKQKEMWNLMNRIFYFKPQLFY